MVAGGELAALCPYGGLPATTTWVFSGVGCKSMDDWCVVDRSCRYIGNESIKFNALGDFSSISESENTTFSWEIVGSKTTTDASLFVLPKYVTDMLVQTLKDMIFQGQLLPSWGTQVISLYVYNIHVDIFPPPRRVLKNIQPVDTIPLPATLNSLSIMSSSVSTNASFSWPVNLTYMKFDSNKLVGLPVLPSSLARLDIQSNQLTTAPSIPLGVLSVGLGYNNLSTSADLNALPDSVTMLYVLPSLRSNLFTNLTNVNFTRFERITLVGNKLKQIANVTFGANLTFLDLTGLQLDFWLMDQSTYTALASLPVESMSYSSFFNATVSKGYTYNLTRINSTAADCNASHGEIKTLWENSKKDRKPPFNNETFTVCVLRVSAPPSTTLFGLGAIVGIAVTGAVLVGAAVFLFMRRQQMAARDTSTAQSHLKEGAGELNMDELKLRRLDSGNVHMDRLLGSGAFGDVWLGSFQTQRVAIKTLRPGNVTVRQVQSFIDEIKLMGSFDSPYIVKLIGAAWSQPSDVKCVMEYMDMGDLREYLETNNAQKYDWQLKTRHIQAIAEGLVYLHSLDIIHRDLKSRNVLLDSTNGVKLTDFGISKEDLQQTMTMGMGTFRWMAPEVISDDGYNSSADVFSFGMVLSEFDSHEVPYKDLKNPKSGEPVADAAIMMKVVGGTLKPTFSTSCPEWIREMAEHCLARDPHQRPTAVQLAHIINVKLNEAKEGHS
ncbi:Aste57867_15021 [Aphanomyces stellatus]|uniref:Aste57867_15021 protein n=1 Tax=Aphanomyces stellatus TaxID=120398 RepID=A0A485L2F6_9STRA|nr:hypothetical protein As57867_014965 [Aphanomyces stellatus]VFT91835.1 Aste57867_15021 [Aphanomyces stellatus]